MVIYKSDFLAHRDQMEHINQNCHNNQVSLIVNAFVYGQISFSTPDDYSWDIHYQLN
jgi:hypothetical protein